ncbi:MAG: response regulator [bacterium]|nr:response regulator [bacterium]
MSDIARRVLIIDDDAVICEVAEGMLADSDWICEHAYDPKVAENKLTTGNWPVVLCDVHLPGDSGELLRLMRKEFPNVQIVMITGDPTMSSLRQALRAGVYDYLLKPLRREELLKVTELALDRYRLLSERDALEIENRRYREQLEQMVKEKTGQLRDTELRYRTLFDHAVDAILLVACSNNSIAELNGTAARMLGARSYSLQGMHVRDFVGGQIDACLGGCTDEYRVWRIKDLTIKGKDQSQHVTNAVISRVNLDGLPYLQIVARDASESIELAQRAELMETELMSEQRLATIGLLATGVAHNINTPLMGIYGLAQVIKMKHPELQDIDGVLSQVERINGIIRNLMWKSRQEQELAKQDIDLNVLLQEELRFLEADMEFKHNVEKVFEFAPDIPPIYGRYSDFSQSIMNIIRNALDAMYDSEEKKLSVSTGVNNGEIQITVSDSGTGIDPLTCRKSLNRSSRRNPQSAEQSRENQPEPDSACRPFTNF